MKRIIYVSIAVASISLAGALWAARWIDKTAIEDFPGKYQLSVARVLWSLTPAIDREVDANRAIKLSWLKASGDINRKEKKEINNILRVLTEEFSFLSEYLLAHARSLSASTQARATVQLLTYLNRVELYDNYPSQALEAKIREFASSISLLDPSIQENWLRETMIRAHLKGNLQLYQANRSQLSKLLNDHGADIPNDFRKGVISFYDGVLSCIGKQQDLAVVPLDDAAKKLAHFPQYTTAFLIQDLNILLIGKGMEAGPGCNQALTDVILSGA